MRFIIIIIFLLISCNTTHNKINEAEINTFIDNWHLAAAKADAEAYFGAMTEDGVYIGTDKTERWYRQEFFDWSKKYFDKGTTWNFKPYDRRIYSSDDQNMVWFDELLDTPNLGICRASGVLQNIRGDWKIKHYHLSVAIDNDLIDSYLKLIEEKKNAQAQMEGHKE